MDLINRARRKVTGVNGENAIQPSPSVAITTLIENPRFKEASIDTSKTVPEISGIFSIDVTNSGILPTRGTRVTGAEIKLIKGQSSIVIGTIDKPQKIGSIAGGETQTVNIKLEREGDLLTNFVDGVCDKGEVNAEVTFTISEILLAATYNNKLKVPVKSSDCTTISIDITGQSDINVDQEYRWEINRIGEGSIGSVTWDMGDGTTYTGNAVRHSYSQTGDYTITVNTEGGYSASLDINVSIVPFGIAGPVDLIIGNEATWNATGENLTQVDTITWNFGNGDTRTTNSNSVTYTYENEGIYTLRAISDSGFDDSLDVDISFPDISIDSISSPDSVNNQEDFNVSVTGNNLSDANTIRWDMGDGTILNGRQVTHRYATSGEYEITVDAKVQGESVSSATKEITAEQFVL
jgi:hypothetical protein